MKRDEEAAFDGGRFPTEFDDVFEQIYGVRIKNQMLCIAYMLHTGY